MYFNIFSKQTRDSFLSVCVNVFIHFDLNIGWFLFVKVDIWYTCYINLSWVIPVRTTINIPRGVGGTTTWDAGDIPMKRKHMDIYYIHMSNDSQAWQPTGQQTEEMFPWRPMWPHRHSTDGHTRGPILE